MTYASRLATWAFHFHHVSDTPRFCCTLFYIIAKSVTITATAITTTTTPAASGWKRSLLFLRSLDDATPVMNIFLRPPNLFRNISSTQMARMLVIVHSRIMCVSVHMYDVTEIWAWVEATLFYQSNRKKSVLEEAIGEYKAIFKLSTKINEMFVLNCMNSCHSIFLVMRHLYGHLINDFLFHWKLNFAPSFNDCSFWAL